MAEPHSALDGLAFLTSQVREAAAHPEDPSIPDLRKFSKNELLTGLHQSSMNLPSAYRAAVGSPLLTWLQGNSYEAEIFWKFYQNPGSADRTTQAFVQAIGDIVQAVLQNGGFGQEQPLREATGAFQEVVSDLYDGFLSEEDREGIKPPDYEEIPALVKWGGSGGPYTLVPDFLNQLGIQTSIVSLPSGFAKTGIVGYTTLGHETVGHDILHADKGLLDEIRKRVLKEIKPNWLGSYWASVVDEAASDVLGLLNFGPAAGIGFLAFFRGWGGRLRNFAPAGDVHPIDILRGFMQVEVLQLIQADSGKQWSGFILKEVMKDLKAANGQIIFPGGRVVQFDHMQPASDAQAVQQSIKAFAKLVASTKLDSLEQHGLGEIQNWSNEDDRIVAELRKQLQEEDYTAQEGYYAAHAVAAATLEGLESKDNSIFERMLKLLDAMHMKNPLFFPPKFSQPAYID